MTGTRLCAVLLVVGGILGCPLPGDAEDIFRQSFDDKVTSQALTHFGGESSLEATPSVIEERIGVDKSAAARLRLRFSGRPALTYSYWSCELPEPMPLVPEVQAISLRLKTTIPLSLKIALAPYGFIYHGPGVGPSEQWQEVRLSDAYSSLAKWCEQGKRRADGAWIKAVIVAPAVTANGHGEAVIDDVRIEGGPGAANAVANEAFRRKTRKVRLAPISLVWDQGHRTLENVLRALDEAGQSGADLACLPQECIDQPPQPIPGPAAEKIARKAAQYKMYVVGNLREQEGKTVYVTSFLCDRKGQIVGKYRKSHRLPYEAYPEVAFELGNELPVFATDLGPVGLKIGTDHYFPEIDDVLRRRGARLIVWSTLPFPVRDEYQETLAIQGRAVDYSLFYAVARYAGKKGYGGYPDAFSWTGTWPIGRAQVFGPDGHTVADSGHAGGVAVGFVPAERLEGGVGLHAGLAGAGPYRELTAAELPSPLARPQGAKRAIRVAAVECEGSFPRLIEKLDACGRQACDLACLWEYVWYQNDEQVEKFKDRNRKQLAEIGAAARRNRMYVVIAGELERGFNEAILFDRDGKEMGRYTKIIQTTDKASRYYRAGDRVGIFDLDFGRICTKICADVYAPEIDRVAALHQVDILLHHTQDAGPYTEHTRLRDHHRCVDNGYFYLRSAGPSGQTDHRTYIMDPWGMILAGSQFQTNNEPVVTTLQLQNRPKYYEWAEAVRRAGAYPDPYQLQKRPVVKGDLRAVVLGARRPELYRAGKD